MFGNYWYRPRKKRKYNRFWDSRKTAQALQEVRDYGVDYLNQKYGADRVAQIQGKIDSVFKSPGRSGGGTGNRRVYINEELGYRKIGSSKANAPDPVKKGQWLNYETLGSSQPKMQTQQKPPKNQQQNQQDDWWNDEWFTNWQGEPAMAGRSGSGGRWGRGRRGDNHGDHGSPQGDADQYDTRGLRYTRTGFGDFGSAPPPPPPPPGSGDDDAFKPGTFKPKMKLNLENDEELAQGSQTPWAQPTSISSVITGLLRDSQQSSANYWDQFFKDKGGQYALDARDSSAWGVDPRWTKDAPTTVQGQALMSPMGAFGTAQVMTASPFPAQLYAAQDQTDPNAPPTDEEEPVGEEPPPMYNDETPILGDKLTPKDSVYNPWAFGEGGEANAYGPNPQYMADATLQSLALANAYFAPQRMQLAYELGDMETDMRRLAVNLGRQVDDPVLQAKLYKEAMSAVRTLDVQQNTFAFQMAEQRRREELQNFQFYDQLAQEEYKTYLQNRLNEAQLELQGRYYGLQRWNIMNPPEIPGSSGSTPTTPVTPPPTTPTTPSSAFSNTPASVTNSNLSGLYGNLLGVGGTNPYTSSLGRSTVTRTRIPI